MNTHSSKAYWALGGTCLLWGSTWVASKFAVAHTPPLQVAAIRQLIAGGLYLLFFASKGFSLPNFQQFKSIFITAFFLLILANGLSTWSILYISTGLGALIGALNPLFVVLIEKIFLKKKIALWTWIGLWVGFIGVGIVFYKNAFHIPSADYPKGIILGIIAALAWSIGTILVARKKIALNPYYAMGWQMLISGIALFAIAIGFRQYQPLSAIPFQTWGAIAYLVAFGSCIAFVCFIYSMRHLPIALASVYAYINPIVAMLIGAYLLNEPLSFTLFFGTAITLLGVYIVNKSQHKKIILQENEII